MNDPQGVAESLASDPREMTFVRKHHTSLGARSLILGAAMSMLLLSGCASTHVDEESQPDEPWGYKPARALGNVLIKVAPF